MHGHDGAESICQLKGILAFYQQELQGNIGAPTLVTDSEGGAYNLSNTSKFLSPHRALLPLPPVTSPEGAPDYTDQTREGDILTKLTLMGSISAWKQQWLGTAGGAVDFLMSPPADNLWGPTSEGSPIPSIQSWMLEANGKLA